MGDARGQSTEVTLASGPAVGSAPRRRRPRDSSAATAATASRPPLTAAMVTCAAGASPSGYGESCALSSPTASCGPHACPRARAIATTAMLGAVRASAVPACHDPAVLEKVRSIFMHGDRHVLKSNHVLEAVDHIHETYFGDLHAGPTLRRYCKAKAHLADGQKPPLFYLIEQDYGFAGLSWNVHSCMIGFDPWRVHDGTCRAVRKWW